MLNDRDWQFKYTPEDGDLVRVFYVPALQDAQRYDRLTGYFDAGALALAARGVEGLVRNDGRMRLVVGCTLDREEIDAIREGETLRDRVERRLTELPLASAAGRRRRPCPGAARLDDRQRPPRREGRRPLRREPAPIEGTAMPPYSSLASAVSSSQTSLIRLKNRSGRM